VADYANQRVQKFDYRGNYLSEISAVGYPTDVAVDASGNVYIVVYGNRILKYDSSFTLISSFGSPGSGDYQFNTPSGVTLDDTGQFVYVVDNGNNRVMKFQSSLSDPGSYVTQWGGFPTGPGPGQFKGPVKVAVNQVGNLYVTDSGNNRIQEFDSSGNYLNEWGSGELDDPLGVAAGMTVEPPLPYVIVADSGNNRCQFTVGLDLVQFGSSGSKHGQFKQPYGVAVGDYIYVVDSGHNRVQAFGWRLTALHLP
jgi:DNA-binding beta-propeller fold protein YncE